MRTTRLSKPTGPDLERAALSDEDTDERLEDGLDGRLEEEGREERRLEDGTEERGGKAVGGRLTSAGDE